jgi:hypothetical protein
MNPRHSHYLHRTDRSYHLPDDTGLHGSIGYRARRAPLTVACMVVVTAVALMAAGLTLVVLVLVNR